MQEILERQLDLLSEAGDLRTSRFSRAIALFLGEQFQEFEREIAETHPSDLAFCLLLMDEEGQRWLLHALSADLAGDVLDELPEPVRASLLEHLGEERLTEIVEQMEIDEAADLVSLLDDLKRGQLLSRVSGELKSELLELTSYREDSAGGIMTTDFVAISDEITVEKAVREIRRIVRKEELDTVYNAFVVDGGGRLLGKVGLNRLLLADYRTKIRDLMEEARPVPIDLDQEEVARLAMSYDDLSVPVVNERNQLVGRITIDDLMDVVRDEASEDLSVIAGSREEEVMERSTLGASRQRLPWLITGLVGGGMAAFVMNAFEDSLSRILALAFFVPLVMAMGGNAGIQASAIVVRTLALNIDTLDIWQRFLREIRISILNGFICSLTLYLIVNLMVSSLGLGVDLPAHRLALAVAGALFLVMVLASTSGVFIPFVLHKVKLDPAVAMGPFIMITNDLLGLAIYLGITRILL